MKDKALVSTLAVLGMAVIALLTALAVTRDRDGLNAQPPVHLSQEVVKAPALHGMAPVDAGAASTSVMGGPPAPANASR